MKLCAEAKGYATSQNAVTALTKKLVAAGLKLEDVRYLVAVNDEGRFVPTLVGEAYIPFIHVGIAVVG